MWRRWSVRSRITAAALAALLPVLLVASLAGIWFQRADLTAGIATLAEDQARTLAADAPDDGGATLVGEESVVQVVSLTTHRVRVIAASDTNIAPLLPAPTGLGAVHQRIAGPAMGEPDAFEAVALRSADGTSYVVVARSLEPVNAATASTAIILLTGGALVLLTTAALTWTATGRALSPVESMRRRAEQVTAEDLAGRLPVPGSRDELARLATTLNGLLARLDDSVRKERQFVADASHELRSPVATIRALVESDRLSPHPGGRDGLSQEVLEETDRLTALVDDLLMLARGDARAPHHFQQTNLTAILHDEVRRARRLSVAADVADALSVDGDAGLLRVAIRNLLDNADRFADTSVRLDAQRVGDRIIISVADDGPGIPAVDRERVFERFVRLDDSRSREGGGSGLGLAITKRIATLHAAFASIRAGANGTKGTTVVLDLPASAARPATDQRRGDDDAASAMR